MKEDIWLENRLLDTEGWYFMYLTHFKLSHTILLNKLVITKAKNHAVAKLKDVIYLLCYSMHKCSSESHEMAALLLPSSA